jgi:hypothetical protein
MWATKVDLFVVKDKRHLLHSFIVHRRHERPTPAVMGANEIKHQISIMRRFQEVLVLNRHRHRVALMARALRVAGLLTGNADGVAIIHTEHGSLCQEFPGLARCNAVATPESRLKTQVSFAQVMQPARE